MNRGLSPEQIRVMTRRAFWIFPLFILFMSYSYLAYEQGTPFFFQAEIHESGTYTLLETIFYFDHFILSLMSCSPYAVDDYFSINSSDIDHSIKRPAIQGRSFVINLNHSTTCRKFKIDGHAHIGFCFRFAPPASWDIG